MNVLDFLGGMLAGVGVLAIFLFFWLWRLLRSIKVQGSGMDSLSKENLILRRMLKNALQSTKRGKRVSK